MKKILKYHSGSLIWGLIIIALLFLPSAGVEGTSIRSLDKAIHATLFGVFCYLLITGLVKQYRFSMRKHSAGKYGLLIAIAFGIATEFVQYFLDYRSFEILDMLADAAGALLGFSYYRFWISTCLRSSYNFSI